MFDEAKMLEANALSNDAQVHAAVETARALRDRYNEDESLTVGTVLDAVSGATLASRVPGLDTNSKTAAEEAAKMARAVKEALFETSDLAGLDDPRPMIKQQVVARSRSRGDRPKLPSAP